MASKYWYVVENQPKHESHLQSQNQSQGVTLPVPLPTIPTDKTLLKYLNSKYYNSEPTPVPPELNVIEPHQDFLVRRDKKQEFCTNSKFYSIITGRDRYLFHGKQLNSIFWCWNDPYEKLTLYDMEEKAILQIQKTELTGYISTKTNFSVSSPPERKLGEIVRIAGFLENPKYEISNSYGQLLFSMCTKSSCTIGSGGSNMWSSNSNSNGHGKGNSSSANVLYVLGKHGKTAYVKVSEDGNAYEMKLYEMCSVMEKAMLLSLLLILDMGKHATH